MTRSLGEVESVARKAARGAGYDWGIADEAGYAVRWLEARGQGGIAALATLLGDVSGQPLSAFAPQSLDDWTSANGTLCPLLTGTTLSDAAAFLKSDPLELHTVKSPALMFPFVAHVARIKSQPIHLSADKAKAEVSAEEVQTTGDWTEPLTIIVTASHTSLHQKERFTRATPDESAWRILNRYASRTYAPATAASRLKGAGAGLSDTD